MSSSNDDFEEEKVEEYIESGS